MTSVYGAGTDPNNEVNDILCYLRAFCWRWHLPLGSSAIHSECFLQWLMYLCSLSLWSRSEKRLWFLTLLLGTCMLYSTRTTMPLLLPAVNILFSYINMIASNFFLLFSGSERIEMEQNRVRHCVELIFLGLHRDTGTKFNSMLKKTEICWCYSCSIQVLGGYFSDRFGGQRVIFFAAIAWSLITFCMPNILLMAPKTWSYSITFIVIVRIINGASQGVHFPAMISLTSQVI